MLKVVQSQNEAILYRQLFEETYSCSIDSIKLNENFIAIVNAGRKTLYFLFEKLKQAPWIGTALLIEAITGEHPVDDYLKNSIIKIQKIWVAWGREHGFFLDMNKKYNLDMDFDPLEFI